MECGVNEGWHVAASARRGWAWWEVAIVAGAMLAALALGLANAAGPSLWHDELVHVYVAKAIAESGRPVLPSGEIQASGAGYSVLLAPVLLLFGDGEAAVRAPSTVFAALNVLLTYVLCRRLLGRGVAVAAAVLLALSPWGVAWSREARFYSMQQTSYLVMLYAAWRAVSASKTRALVAWTAMSCLAFLLSLTLSFHSIIFLASVGCFFMLMALIHDGWRTRWTAGCAVVAVLGILALLWNALAMTGQDYDTTVTRAGLGLSRLHDLGRTDRLFYLNWLRNNLSNGFFILALAGSAGMFLREGGRGLYAFLGFWGPVMVLTWLIGYRRPRFMFFAYPFYVAACAYGIVLLAGGLRGFRRSWLNAAAALIIVLFGARLAVSAARLLGDSLEAASGMDITLARRHPKWREPCRYVRERCDGAAVLTTTYLPVLHYVGRVDDWYPSHKLWWEHVESGSPGIKTVEELAAFVVAHPRGYFLADVQRFSRWTGRMAEHVAWVEQNMTPIEEASNRDITVWAWGPGAHD